MAFLFCGAFVSHVVRAWPVAPWGLWLLALFGLPYLRRLTAVQLVMILSSYLWVLLTAAPLRRCDTWLWFFCEAQPERDLVMIQLTGSPLGQLAHDLRAWLTVRCLAWDPRWGAWLLGMLTGANQDEALQDLYKQLGLLHALVVSGSHFSVLTLLLSRLMLGPWRLAYSLWIFSARPWASLRFFLEMTILGCALLFLVLVGGQAPCQRAFLVLVIHSVSKWTRTDANTLYPTAFAAQALLFPSSFFTVSNFLSWAATACVGLKRRQGNLIVAECLIQSLSFALFASFSPAGALINILLAPLWDVILLLAVLLVVWENPILGTLLRWGAEHFHAGLAWVAGLQQSLWMGSSLEVIPALSACLRWVALVPISFVLMMALQRRQD